ncbi:MAG: glucose-6-phosphate isomerase [Sedimenticola sp.]|nr:glucose-6-phosphate isomerase [Sedimenticola sp.]
MTLISQSSEWQALSAHWQKMQDVQMRDLFSADPDRFNLMSVEACGLLLDYSKNRIDQNGLNLLQRLAEKANLKQAIDALFLGAPVNSTEQSAALHTALRYQKGESLIYEGRDVMVDVTAVLNKMEQFTAALRAGEWRGATGKPITDVVNLGVGGSHLGPKMVTEALAHYANHTLRLHFVSNIDGTHLSETLRHLDPHTTLFTVTSKSFATPETMANARVARQWCQDGMGPSVDVLKHFIAISANRKRVAEFGVAEANFFQIWDWVGGRFSLWSAVGLPIALSIGMPRFRELLAGAAEMDAHFRTADFDKNIPVLLGLLGIWYIDFAGITSHAVMPYDQYLRYFPAYLQQLEMESNGKSTTLDGQTVDYQTGPFIWGSVGSDGQHSYFQLFHQGTHLTTTDFIVPVNSHNPLNGHHEKLLANCLAQTEAMMTGVSIEEICREDKQSIQTASLAGSIQQHKTCIGNRPSNTLITKLITPEVLGALLACYEHKTYVQGVIWQVNPFDQWGVELGKKLARVLEQELVSDSNQGVHDASTQGLLNYCRKNRKI